MEGDLFNFVVFLLLLFVGFTAGTVAEKQHYKSIRRREKQLLNIPAVTIKSVLGRAQVAETQLVTGSVVVSLDYFKRALAGLRNFFGGRIRSYETLLDRGRREALLRMKESAYDADAFINVRMETSAIGQNAQQRKSIGSIEVLAYGTAIKLVKKKA